MESRWLLHLSRGVADRVERTMETSRNWRRVGLRGALDKALADGGGILTAEDGNAGSFTGLFRGVKDGSRGRIGDRQWL